MAVRISVSLRNAALGAVAGVIDGPSGTGKIEFYTGSVAGSFGSAPAGTKLATCPFGFPAFASASAGSMAANAITADDDADASGTVGCFVIRDHSNNIVMDGTCTATGGGGDITFDSTTITLNATVAVTSLTLSQPQS